MTFVTQDRRRAGPVRRSFRLQRGAPDRPGQRLAELPQLAV